VHAPIKEITKTI